MTYEISYLDDDGTDHVIEGDSLESLQQQLAEGGYDGPSIRVRDEQGNTRGWVRSDTWRAA